MCWGCGSGLMMPACPEELITTRPRSPSRKQVAFMPMLVGLRLSGELVLGEMVVHIGVCVAAEAVLDAEFDPSVGQNMFDAGARHRAGRESGFFDYDGDFREYG